MTGCVRASGSRRLGWIVLWLFCVARGAAQEGTAASPWPYTATTVRNAYIHSSPAIGPDGTIYFGVAENTNPAKGRLVALNPNATPKWAGAVRDGFITDETIDSSPAVAEDGTVYFGVWNGLFFALNGATGAEKWRFNVDTAKIITNPLLPPAGFIESSPAIGPDGRIFFGSGDATHPELSALHALFPDGREHWRFVVGDRVPSAPAIGRDGTIYFGSWDKTFYAVRPDGTEKWRYLTNAAIDSAPAIGPDGTIYVGTLAQGLLALTPEGKLKWSFPMGSISSGVTLGPDGTIYVGSVQDWIVYAVRPPDAEHPQAWTKWTYDPERPISSTPTVRGDGVVIVGLERDELGQGGVVALEPVDGKVRWFYPIPETVSGSPVIDSTGRIYVGAYDRKLHAINGNNSTLSQFSTWPMFGRNERHAGRLAAGGRLVNIATRADAGTAPLIAGFTVSGPGIKNLLVRGVGPGLAQNPFNVPNTLENPIVRVRSPSDFLFLENDDWQVQEEVTLVQQTMARVGAFPLPDGSKDAAFVLPVIPGLYTASVERASGAAGTGLIEIYDADLSESANQLINLSTLCRVNSPGQLIIPGFVVRGNGPARVLIRAVGPGLAPFQVPDRLARPTMAVFSGSRLLRTNTGWTNAGAAVDLVNAFAAVGAFPLANGSSDCAALFELMPGDYTVQVTGVGGDVGNVLVEVYLLP